MGQWKSLKKDSGTGWKELHREAGTGWKALEWETTVYEDITTFTEVDPNSRITITSVRASGAHYRNEDAYVYKDYGVDHFNALDIQFEIEVVSSAASAIGPFFALSNVIDEIGGFGTTDMVITIDNFGGVTKYFRLVRGTYTSYDNWTGGALSTKYYCWLKRTEGNDTITLEIRTGSHTGTLEDTLSVSGFGTAKWRYLYVFNTRNNGTTENVDGYTENVKLL